jgi:DNA-damage-inducible protein D
METKVIQDLMQHFEEAKHLSPEGIEFWLARDLQPLLGYEKRERFSDVISKAKTSCESS